MADQDQLLIESLNVLGNPVRVPFQGQGDLAATAPAGLAAPGVTGGGGGQAGAQRLVGGPATGGLDIAGIAKALGRLLPAGTPEATRGTTGGVSLSDQLRSALGLPAQTASALGGTAPAAAAATPATAAGGIPMDLVNQFQTNPQLAQLLNQIEPLTPGLPTFFSQADLPALTGGLEQATAGVGQAAAGAAPAAAGGTDLFGGVAGGAGALATVLGLIAQQTGDADLAKAAAAVGTAGTAASAAGTLAGAGTGVAGTGASSALGATGAAGGVLALPAAGVMLAALLDQSNAFNLSDIFTGGSPREQAGYSKAHAAARTADLNRFAALEQLAGGPLAQWQQAQAQGVTDEPTLRALGESLLGGAMNPNFLASSGMSAYEQGHTPAEIANALRNSTRANMAFRGLQDYFQQQGWAPFAIDPGWDRFYAPWSDVTVPVEAAGEGGGALMNVPQRVQQPFADEAARLAAFNAWNVGPATAYAPTAAPAVPAAPASMDSIAAAALATPAGDVAGGMLPEEQRKRLLA
jgi:hypothetical protein